MRTSPLSRRRWLALAGSSLVPIDGAGRTAAAQEATVAARPRFVAVRVDALAPVAVAHLEPLAAGGTRPVVTAIAVDPAGRLLAVAGDDLVIRLLETERLVETGRLVGHRDRIRSLDFRADGRALVSGGNDGRMIVWDRGRDWVPGGEWGELPPIYRARFSPDGRRLAAVGFRSQPWLLGAEGTTRLTGAGDDPRGLTIDPSGTTLVVADRNGGLHRYRLPSGEPLGRLETPALRVRDVGYVPGRDWVATVGEDGVITVVDGTRGTLVRQISLLPCKLFALAAVDQDRVAVAGSDNRVRLVDCAEGQVVGYLDGHQGSINSLAHAEGCLYSGGFDTTVRKWRVDGSQTERLAEKDRVETPSR